MELLGIALNWAHCGIDMELCSLDLELNWNMTWSNCTVIELMY